jgi:hypothetical protein
MPAARNTQQGKHSIIKGSTWRQHARGAQADDVGVVDLAHEEHLLSEVFQVLCTRFHFCRLPL